jgi:hypothetical protein
VGPDLWPEFLARRSYDGSRVLGGVRCRVNVLRSSRGGGLAVRLLAAEVPTLARLNLPPDLADLARLQHGLVLVCGPTGAGFHVPSAASEGAPVPTLEPAVRLPPLGVRPRAVDRPAAPSGAAAAPADGAWAIEDGGAIEELIAQLTGGER